MSSATISAAFIVHNEAARLEWAIAEIRPFVDEVVVTVQQSDDDTLEIARRLADVVIEHPHYGFASASRAETYGRCKSEWVLVIDADENLSAAGKQRLRALAADTRVDFYWLRRLTLVEGRQLEDRPHGRLFRRAGGANIPTKVHTDQTPATGRQRTIGDTVIIEHFKSEAEQRADDLRYRTNPSA